MSIISKMKSIYEMGVYKHKIRYCDYFRVTDNATGEQFGAPVANLLLALQYSAAAINFTGTVTVWYPGDFYWDDYVPVEIAFKDGLPTSFVGNTSKSFYGQTELLRRISGK